jgi:hypothetical protein
VGRASKRSRRTRKGECFWFSGAPGTGVRVALGKVRSFVIDSVDREIVIISLEDFVWEEFKKAYPERDDYNFKSVLDQPPSKVQGLWKLAARAAMEKIQESLTHGVDVFLTFHTVYYTDKFANFYSPVDLAILRDFPKPKKFINFIDDIGDVATRLREEGQVFSSRKKSGLASVTDAIRDLLTLLEWRSQETTASRLVGTIVGEDP